MAKVAGLKVKVNKADAERKKGTKTAWMATRWVDGEEVEAADEALELPCGGEVPRVSEYKHLGTPMRAAYEGRHDAARKKVVDACTRTLWAIGKVPGLRKEQLKRAMRAAVAEGGRSARRRSASRHLAATCRPRSRLHRCSESWR